METREVAASLESVQIVTTQMVLTEALNFMAGLGELRRRFAAQMVQELEHSPDVEVIPQTDAQFKGRLRTVRFSK